MRRVALRTPTRSAASLLSLCLLLAAACSSPDPSDGAGAAPTAEVIDSVGAEDVDESADQSLTDEAAEADSPAAAAPPGQRVELAELLNAPVDAVCVHPAGRLRDGTLEGVEEGFGVLTFGPGTIEALRAGDEQHPRVARGDLSGDGVEEVAVVIQCNAGGVGLPDHVLIYGSGPTHLATFTPSDHDGDREGRQFVSLVDIDGGWLHLEWGGHQQGDIMVAPTLLITARARLLDGQLRVEDVEVVDEQPTVRAALAAASRGDRAALAELASPDAGELLLNAAGMGPFGDDFGCFGLADLRGTAPSTGTALDDDTLRVCEIPMSSTPGEVVVVELHSPDQGVWWIAHADSTARMVSAAPGTGTGSGERSIIVERFGDTDVEVPLTDDPAVGSGCRPGSDTLPDGVWFGYVDDLDATALSFDLACMYRGEEAYARIGDDHGFDLVIENDSPVLRRVPLSPNTRIFVFEDSYATGQLLSFGPGDVNALRTHLLARSPSSWYGESPELHGGVWILIENGALIEIVESIYGFVS